MKQLWFPLVSCLILGSLPLDAVHTQQRSIVRVALPGTIEPVILTHIGPAFTAATGYYPRAIDRTGKSHRQRRTQARCLHQFRREPDEVVVRTG